MIGPVETLEHLDVPPQLRPLARALQARGPSFGRLLWMELRKSVDTRASRWVLLAVPGLAVAGVLLRLRDAGLGPVIYAGYVGDIFLVLGLVLPVVGVLAMTAEWSQRTALSTFTLVPRRGRVLTVKVVAAVVVATATALVCAGIAAVGVLAAAQSSGSSADWSAAPEATFAGLSAIVLSVLMGSAFGALLPSTAAALVACYVLPAGFAVAGSEVFGEAAAWLDIRTAFSLVSLEQAQRQWPQIGVAVTVWVLLPLVVGVVRSLRREVK